MLSAGVRACGHRQRAAPRLAGTPRGGLVSLRISLLDKFLIISSSSPLFCTEAVAPKRIHGPHPGSALRPLPFEVGNLPSTHRSNKAKGDFKAKLCARPKMEAYPMKVVNLPGPLPLIDAHQGFKGMGDVKLEKKPLLQASLSLCRMQHQIKRSK